MEKEYIEPDQQEVDEPTNVKPGKQALPVKWNINTTLVAYAVLATVILLRLEGVSTQIVAPVAIFGLAATWLLGLLRNKRMYQRAFNEGRHGVQEVQHMEREPVVSKSPLTPKETIILTHIASGYINKEIAFMLGISEQTIKNHIYNIMQKLDVNDRTHAVVLALQNGWLSLNDTMAKSPVSVAKN
ncbi:response regulator transcription factor [Chloroflexota bacterium]